MLKYRRFTIPKWKGIAKASKWIRQRGPNISPWRAFWRGGLLRVVYIWVLIIEPFGVKINWQQSTDNWLKLIFFGSWHTFSSAVSLDLDDQNLNHQYRLQSSINPSQQMSLCARKKTICDSYWQTVLHFEVQLNICYQYGLYPRHSAILIIVAVHLFQKVNSLKLPVNVIQFCYQQSVSSS